jgi:hypothetical protein
MGRTPLTPQSPGALAAGLAKYIKTEKAMNISAPQVQAVLSFRNEYVKTPDYLAAREASIEAGRLARQERDERALARAQRRLEEANRPKRPVGRPRKVDIEKVEETDAEDPTPQPVKRVTKNPVAKRVAKTARNAAADNKVTAEKPARKPAAKKAAPVVKRTRKAAPGPVDPEDEAVAETEAEPSNVTPIKRTKTAPTKRPLRAKTAGRKVSF